MSELFKIVLTACLTVFGGIFVFVVGQIIVKFLIEPIHELYRLRGQIADSLIFYKNVYANPGNSEIPRTDIRADETQELLRQHASQIISKIHLIRWNRLVELIGIVERFQDLKEGSRALITLSNSIHIGRPETNQKTLELINKHLNLKIIDTESHTEEGDP